MNGHVYWTWHGVWSLLHIVGRDEFDEWNFEYPTVFPYNLANTKQPHRLDTSNLWTRVTMRLYWVGRHYSGLQGGLA